MEIVRDDGCEGVRQEVGNRDDREYTYHNIHLSFCIKHYGWFYKSPPLVLPNKASEVFDAC